MSPIDWMITFPHNRVEIVIATVVFLWMAKLTLQSFTGGVFRA